MMALLAFEALIVGATAVGIAVAAAGPFQVTVFGATLHARGAATPLALGVAGLFVRLVLAWRGASIESRPRIAADATFRLAILALLAADLTLVLTHLVASCGGLDSAGYLGSSQLFLAGRLTALEPVGRVLPFPDATAAAAPLGFVPSATLFHIAPRFPPGLPLTMAAARLIGGSAAPFYVAPVLAVVAVAVAFVTTRRAMGSVVAGLAAVMLASSPVFINLALQPMSDVPATCWVLLAVFFLWRPAPLPVAGGIAIGLATLTRPPLALAALALIATTRWRGWRQAAAFGAVAAIFLAALLALQWHIYGDPLKSGYGTASQLFSWGAFGANVSDNVKWALTVHTPLLAVLFLAGAAFDRDLGWRAAAMFLAVAFPYLIYAPRFQDWEILRFLLPGLPFVFVVCASAVVKVAGASAHPARAAIVATCVAAAATAGSYAFLAQQHVFDLRQREQKYPLVGEWFATHTPPNAVAMASLHSGSLRYYSGRTVLRVDALPPGMLGETVDALQRAGYAAYVVLEQGEEFERYQRDFHPDTIPRLTTEPLERLRGVHIFRLTMR